ncbi:thiamine phosphate synthase [Serpentinimonas maccroryi]|uniref:thiamine phosphate synthase n=1 Tax=Serpentinimonas maccroryi TaxID=1458426 RepID=UPI0020335E2E|nr:thiamine phosphate synthase [Serpentinimonas maccroryi]MCM2478753.1 thiamine phosphate synthase [Serpentinimonas maccroryi]
MHHPTPAVAYALAAPATLDALVRQHAALAIEAQADPGAIPASDSAYDVAWAVARRLGFIESDAAVIAQAWGQRSAREGHWRADWPDDPLDFGLGTAAAATQPGSAAEHPAATNSPPPFASHPDGLGLYAVLPNAAWVQRMAAAGVPTLQLRYKPSANPGPGTPPEAEVLAQVRAAVAAVASTASRLYINDHWQAAIEAGAYGVHLGQEDLDALAPEALDALRSAGLRLGISTHGYAELLRAAALRPSYIALGAVFPTTLKAMPTAPQGCARLRAYAQLLARLRPAIPTVAIGGIGLEHLGAIAASGVGSFAVVRALTASPDPAAAAQALQRRWAELRPLTGA